MQLSPAGQVLLTHVRKLLEIETRAASELRGLSLSGDVRFGMPQDFAFSRLSETLTHFRRIHSGVRVAAVIERNGVIASLSKQGELDLAMLITRTTPPRALASTRRASHWYAAQKFEWDTARPLPLILLEGPCIYRDDALKALERGGQSWEVVFTTGSVTAMWAAVTAGVGLTVRMDLGAPQEVRSVDAAFRLPKLPSTMVSLVKPGLSRNDSVSALAQLVGEALMRSE